MQAVMDELFKKDKKGRNLQPDSVIITNFKGEALKVEKKDCKKEVSCLEKLKVKPLFRLR